MIHIALSLLGALILSWFNFDLVVLEGMSEVFGKTISTTGYYFLFGLLGALKSIGASFAGAGTVKFKTKEDEKK